MDKIGKLNDGFWKYFKEISTIPRKSGEEKKIAEYLINFAIERDLKYHTDDLHNVVIWKEASVGYEYEEILGLQCHTDMICEKKINIEHDFLVEPLDLVVEENFIKANNTTLGADNGIGVAYILAILDSKKIKNPKLECIFTTQEETTMNGVNYLDSSILKSKKIVSFDNFKEDEILISSATAKKWSSLIKEDKIELTPNKFSTFCLNLYHFKGGHSGLDIGDNSRENPIKIVAKLLEPFSSIYVVDLEGGSDVNIIPRNCKITFSINNYELTKIPILENEIKKIKKRYSSDISFNKIDTITKCYSKQFSKNILNFIIDFPNGVLSKDEYGNIVLSGNFGAIKKENETLNIFYSIRYNSKMLGIELEKKIQDLMEKNNIQNREQSYILGYEQNEDSELIKYCEKLYFKKFNKKIRKVKSQACLECGYLSTKIPNLQYIAIAPDILNAHSPNEKMSIKSANKIWDFIVILLENVNLI